MSRDFLRFCLVGGIGFLVDAGLTTALVRAWLFDPIASRIAAFLCAASVTYWLHCVFTFKARKRRAGLLAYVAVTSGGALINVGTYAIVVGILGASTTGLLGGVAAGSALALAFNFFASKAIIFRGAA